MNPTLKQIHAMLLAQHAALFQALGGTTDATKQNAILLEMQEILNRVNLVQNLLFRQASQQLTALLPGIKAANDALTNSIQGINDIATFVKATTAFLQGVDQAIDIAKALATA